jgi:hypothetical protein
MSPNRSFGNFSGRPEVTSSVKEYMMGKPLSHSCPGSGWPVWMHRGRSSALASS